MPAFPEDIKVTGSYNYLRKEARDLGFNPCFDHVSISTVLQMNKYGSNGVLHCPGNAKIKCPCNELESTGECDQGVFRRL